MGCPHRAIRPETVRDRCSGERDVPVAGTRWQFTHNAAARPDRVTCRQRVSADSRAWGLAVNIARIVRVVGVVGLLAGAVLAVPAVAVADSSPIWGDAVPATFATGIQNAAPNAYLSSVSCAPAGYCTAAGNFVHQDGSTQAFTQSSIGSEPPVLPPTGADTDGFIAAAVVFLAAGGLLVVTRRRRVLSA